MLSVPASVRIRRAGPEDAAVLAGLAATAFADDPLVRHLLPGPVARRFGLPTLTRALVDLSWLAQHGTSVAELDGAVVGFAVWASPHSAATPLPALLRRLPGWPLMAVPAATPGWSLARPLNALRQLELARPTVPHWSLECLAVHPQVRRGGVGAALLADQTAAADRHGDAMHAHAISEESRQALAQCGFQRIGEVHPHRRAPRIVSMYRPGEL